MVDNSYERQERAGLALVAIKEKWPRLFMALAHHKNTDGDQMTFGDKLWLKAIYQDNSHKMVVIKCSQVHLTEHALCAMFTYANKGKRGMYILPSKEHRRTFVKDRIDSLKDNCPEYAKAIKKNHFTEGDSNVFKTIYGTGWKFVGSNVKKDFFEFPCSVLFFDEYDELVQDNLPYADQRVENDPDPIIWKFGNPTFDGTGIHAEWLKSDQKEWVVGCEHCGHKQTLDWYKHFVTKDEFDKYTLRNAVGRPICESCHKDFNRLNTGKWVAQNPGSDISGYRISRLFVYKGKKPNDILFLFNKFMDAQNNSIDLQVFHNNYLGVTFEHSDEKITEESLIKASQKYDSLIEALSNDPQTPRAIMGVDQGKHFTCTISVIIDGIIHDIHHANVYRWSDVEALEETFNVAYTVVDANGGGYAETRDFVAKKGSRWMCYYRPKDQVKKLFDLDHAKQVVTTNRTEICDTMCNMYKNEKMGLHPDFANDCDKQFKKQMLMPNRTVDAGGRPIWTKGIDHFFHASNYRMLAYLISGMKDSRLVKRNWKARTVVVKDRPEPKVQIIGEIKGQPVANIKKKKSWRV